MKTKVNFWKLMLVTLLACTIIQCSGSNNPSPTPVPSPVPSAKGNISPPNISGPVSICNSSVVVKGQLIGSTVWVLLNGDLTHPIANGTASWTEEEFTLTNLPSIGLQPGDRLTAVQSFGTDVSEETAEPTLVVQGFDPSYLNHITTVSHLYSCGRHLMFDGLVPGSMLEVDQAGQLVKANAPNGFARVSLSLPLKFEEQLDLRQAACGQVGPVNQSPSTDQTPMSPERKLDPPHIASQPHACDLAVKVDQVIDGADVTLFRSGVKTGTAGFDLPSLWWNPLSPFLEGEKFTVIQGMQNCDIVDSDESSPSKVVLPAIQALPPTVAYPLCANSQIVRVYSVSPGLNVRVLQNGSQIGLAGAYDSFVDVGVSPLIAGAKITAQEERCGVWGNESSTPVNVDPLPAQIPPPSIAVDPLFECSTVVPVKGIYPGSLVRVFSRKIGQISAITRVDSSETTIPVRPALQTGDEIYVEEIACSSSVSSNLITVQPAPELDYPKIIEPVYAVKSYIVVNSVVPGAIVEIYLNGRFQKAVNAGLSEVTIDLGVQLQVGDKLNARQILCNRATELDPEQRVVVKKPKPDAPIKLSPNATTVGGQVILQWIDPGKGQAQAADSFQIKRRLNNTDLPIVTSTSTSYTWSGLDPSQEVKWAVRGVNSSGEGPWSEEAGFSTADPIPNINSFSLKQILSDQYALVEWNITCTPSCNTCNIWIEHLWYGGDDHHNLNPIGSQQVYRNCLCPPTDGIYRLIVECGRNKTTKDVTISRNPTCCPQTQMNTYYFKMVDPDSWVEPCYTVAVQAPDLETAKKIAWSECGNCKEPIEIQYSEYIAGCSP